MHIATKRLLKELIEFYEGCGRDRRKTTSYFVRAKKGSNDKISKLLTRYIRQGSSLLDIQTKRTGPRFLQPIALETSKKVLKLLQEDPTITIREGAQILGISSGSFLKHKNRLLTPGKLTTEMKIQLGIIPSPPEDEKEKRTKIRPSTSNAKLELGTDPEGVDFDNDLQSFEFDVDGASIDEVFQNEGACKTEPITPRVESRGPGTGSLRRKYCLLCYVPIDPKMKSGKKITRSESSPFTILVHSIRNDDNSEFLRGNLNVIFALKNILGLGSTDLIKFMKASKGRNPQEWYHLCSDCDRIMKEAVVIQFQVLQLSRKLERFKSKIQEKVKESCGRGLDKLEAADVNGDLLVTKLIRESICPRKKKRTKIWKSGSAGDEVKTEPVNEDEREDHESFWNHDADQEIVMNPPTGEIVPPSDDDNVNLSPSTETDLTSIIGVNKSAASVRDLKMKPKLVICDLCGAEVRIFALPLHTLRVHDIVMDGYTEFKCQETGCHYKTVYNLHFKNHINRVHVPSRKFSCQFCGKKFKCNSHLRCHENLHKNAETKPYQCEVCGRSFAGYATLWNHVKGVHEGYVSPFRRRLLAQNKKKKTEILTDAEGSRNNPIGKQPITKATSE